MCKCVKWIACLLTVVGALNWGLWGFFQFDLVAWICGGNTGSVARVVYAVVGLAGVYTLRKLFCCKSRCSCGCSCCGKEGSSSCKDDSSRGGKGSSGCCGR